jgi:iron complex outermembrane receptor protein
MPPSLKLNVAHQWGGLATTAEAVVVAEKTAVSHVRNELSTGGYALLNLRMSYVWRYVRLDAEVENVLGQFYALPLGGAYVGQGASMSTTGIRWGVQVPGRGRSLNIGVTFRL